MQMQAEGQTVERPATDMPTDALQGAGDGGMADHGRAVVRSVFLARLDAAGLVRPKRASVAEHEARLSQAAPPLRLLCSPQLLPSGRGPPAP